MKITLVKLIRSGKCDWFIIINKIKFCDQKLPQKKMLLSF